MVDTDTKLISELFEQQVQKTPNNIAVTFGQESLTYLEVNHKANRLARWIKKQYLQIYNQEMNLDTLIGLCLDRGLESVISVLAILKTNAAYVSIDPVYPKNYLDYIFRDAELKLLITKHGLLLGLPEQLPPTISLDRDNALIEKEDPRNLDSKGQSNQLAYVIYTSGSTGRPKGVLVEHRQVLRLFFSTQALFNFNDKDIWTLFHSLSFDFSVWELWGSLLYGGQLIIVPYWTSRDPELFYKLLQKSQVTILNQTPSAFANYIAVDLKQDLMVRSSLRYIIFGGEKLNPNYLKKWFDKWGDQHPKLINMYGITETTVHVTYYLLTQKDTEKTNSIIGSPLPDLRVYLLDEQGQRVPPGSIGEMHVGGEGVTRGYLNHPELTTTRFISDPFSDKNERIYCTGDLAYQLSDGTLVYYGRKDNQIKVRGFRIEPAEIEAILMQHNMVRDVRVTTLESSAISKKLLACIILSEDALEYTNSELMDMLHEHGSAQLPYYMIPNEYIFVDSFPLTNNGKLDLQYLALHLNCTTDN